MRNENFYRVAASIKFIPCLLLATRESIVLLEDPLKAVHASLQGLEL